MKYSHMHLLKPLTFLPALLILYIIFSFSEQNGENSGQLSYLVSQRIIETGSTILNVDLTQEAIDIYANKIHGPIRKTAHMTEYALLAISLLIPLFLYNINGLRLKILVAFLCIVFASMDEFHQSFIDGRVGSVTDILIDTIGASFGILFTQIWKPIIYRNNAKSKRRV